MEKSLAQLSISTGGLGILDINTLLNFLKIIQSDSKVVKSHLWKDLMLYRLNLILNSNQGLTLFSQTHTSESFWSVFSRIQTATPYLCIFSPNAGKYGPEKLQIRTLFTQ